MTSPLVKPTVTLAALSLRADRRSCKVLLTKATVLQSWDVRINKLRRIKKLKAYNNDNKTLPNSRVMVLMYEFVHFKQRPKNNIDWAW